MLSLDASYGPLRGRLWVLIVNLCGNILMLHGAVRWYAGSPGAGGEMVTGVAVTVVCVALLAVPDR